MSTVTEVKRPTITNIEWERIFLNIEIRSDAKEGICYVQNSRNSERYALETEPIKDGFKMCINMSCVHDREFLENGRWIFVLEHDGIQERIAVSSEVARRAEELSRVYRYAEEQMAYTVSFGIETVDEETLELYMDSYFLEENKKWKKRKYVREVRSPRRKLSRAVVAIAAKTAETVYKLNYAVARHEGKRVMLISQTHDYLWGNLKAIDDEIKKQGLDRKYKIEYTFSKSAEGKLTLKNSLDWLRSARKIAKQDIIFVDDYAPIFGFFKLGDKTKLIQVWHAGVGFKSVGYARFGRPGSPFPQKSCHKQYTNAIIGAENLSHVYEEVFGIEKEALLPLGMPRMDGFLDKDSNKPAEYEGKRVILFAPTFRGTGQSDAYYDYTWIDYAGIHEMCVATNSIWIFKMHPFIGDSIDIPKEYSDTIKQLGSEENINDLYHVTDVLITDYSSNYYEYALTGGACVFYTPDREIYELTRGVHRAVKECAPGKVCDTFDELMMALDKNDYEIDKTKVFVKDNYGDYTGDASAKVVERFLK